MIWGTNFLKIASAITFCKPWAELIPQNCFTSCVNPLWLQVHLECQEESILQKSHLQLQFLIGHQRKFLWVIRGCQASQRKGLTSGEIWGTSGEVWGTSRESGKLPGGHTGLLLSSTVRELPGKSPGNLRGKFGELPGKSGDFREARGSLTPSQRLAKFGSKVCEPFSPLQLPKTPRTPNLSKICPGDCFWGFQSGGLELVKNLSKFEKR